MYDLLRPLLPATFSLDLPHRYQIKINPSDIDSLGHVNNATYLTWVQAAVLDHWHTVAGVETIAAYTWIAISHEITYRRPAHLEDVLVAVVMLDQVRGESAYYQTQIWREGVLVAEARSRWCWLDIETLRPARVPVELCRASRTD